MSNSIVRSDCMRILAFPAFAAAASPRVGMGYVCRHSEVCNAAGMPLPVRPSQRDSCAVRVAGPCDPFRAFQKESLRSHSSPVFGAHAGADPGSAGIPAPPVPVWKCIGTAACDRLNLPAAHFRDRETRKSAWGMPGGGTVASIRSSAASVPIGRFPLPNSKTVENQFQITEP